MYSQTKIAIPIFQQNCEDVIEVAHDCIDKGADVLEFRIDALSREGETTRLYKKDTRVEVIVSGAKDYARWLHTHKVPSRQFKGGTGGGK